MKSDSKSLPMRLCVALFTIVQIAYVLQVSTSARSGAAERLTGGELEEAVAGIVVYMESEGGVVPISYNANKTMTGELQAVAAMLSGDTPKNDQGKWWIDESRLCQQWNHWLDGKTHCYKLKQDGETVHWERNDGRKGSARLGK